MSPPSVSSAITGSGFPRVSGDEPLIMAKNIKTVFRFPRVSGDEPVLRSARAASTAFSPRERG